MILVIENIHINNDNNNMTNYHDLIFFWLLFIGHGGGWGYSGHSVEAVRFMSDSDILLGGFSLFGGRGEYMGKIKVTSSFLSEIHQPVRLIPLVVASQANAICIGSSHFNVSLIFELNWMNYIENNPTFHNKNNGLLLHFEL